MSICKEKSLYFYAIFTENSYVHKRLNRNVIAAQPYPQELWFSLIGPNTVMIGRFRKTIPSF